MNAKIHVVARKKTASGAGAGHPSLKIYGVISVDFLREATLEQSLTRMRDPVSVRYITIMSFSAFSPENLILA